MIKSEKLLINLHLYSDIVPFLEVEAANSLKVDHFCDFLAGVTALQFFSIGSAVK